MAISVQADPRADRSIYKDPRATRDYVIANEGAQQRFQSSLGTHLPIDPHYPDPQAVHSTYLLPNNVDPHAPRVDVRLREYLGPAASQPANDSQRAVFVELKDRLPGDLQKKSRVGVTPDALKRMANGESAHVALGVAERSGDDRATAQRVADLLDGGFRLGNRTEYVRSAWENPAGTIRLTVDHQKQVDIATSAVKDKGIRLEVKTVGDLAKVEAENPWLRRVLTDSVAAGDMVPKDDAAKVLTTAAKAVRTLQKLA